MVEVAEVKPENLTRCSLSLFGDSVVATMADVVVENALLMV